ncbi:acyl-CoA dehydrogenase family protein [Dactylosporangium sp. NPDC005555]|uniref:acyl-CoA dehydrogenase family protein n=1 Tax=Dactylosporangium sp. NPDC005555 TaxID=3154889 RepID=UPI0033A04B51
MLWSQEQQELHDGVLAVAATLGSDHVDRDAAGTFDTEGWKRLAELGLFGLPFGEQYGGLAQDLPTTMYALEALGTACRDGGLNFSAVTHLVSTGVALHRFGSARLKQRYLPDVCAGSIIGAHAVTEPAGGSDITPMRTTAVPDGDDFVLNGSKAFVSNGPIADVILVYARTGKLGNPAAISTFLVPRGTPGLSVGQPVGKMGLRTSPLAELFLDDVRVPRADMVGSQGAGLLILDAVMQWEILCGFVVNLGEMQHRLDRCVAYARTRRQFGEHIGRYQAISHRIVDMGTDVETARMWLYTTARKLAAGRTVTADVARTKLIVSESNVRSALAAVQIFGGYGYTTEYGLEQELRNSVSGTIYSGTSEIQRERLAALMGLHRPLDAAPRPERSLVP